MLPYCDLNVCEFFDFVCLDFWTVVIRLDEFLCFQARGTKSNFKKLILTQSIEKSVTLSYNIVKNHYTQKFSRTLINSLYHIWAITNLSCHLRGLTMLYKTFWHGAKGISFHCISFSKYGSECMTSCKDYIKED